MVLAPIAKEIARAGLEGGIAGLSEVQCLLAARDILLSTKRTSSGGDVWVCVDRLCGISRELVVVCPASNEADPLHIAADFELDTDPNTTGVAAAAGGVALVPVERRATEAMGRREVTAGDIPDFSTLRSSSLRSEGEEAGIVEGGCGRDDVPRPQQEQQQRREQLDPPFTATWSGKGAAPFTCGGGPTGGGGGGGGDCGVTAKAGAGEKEEEEQPPSPTLLHPRAAIGGIAAVVASSAAPRVDGTASRSTKSDPPTSPCSASCSAPARDGTVVGKPAASAKLRGKERRSQGDNSGGGVGRDSGGEAASVDAAGHVDVSNRTAVSGSGSGGGGFCDAEAAMLADGVPVDGLPSSATIIARKRPPPLPPRPLVRPLLPPRPPASAVGGEVGVGVGGAAAGESEAAVVVEGGGIASVAKATAEATEAAAPATKVVVEAQNHKTPPPPPLLNRRRNSTTSDRRLSDGAYELRPTSAGVVNGGNMRSTGGIGVTKRSSPCASTSAAGASTWRELTGRGVVGPPGAGGAAEGGGCGCVRVTVTTKMSYKICDANPTSEDDAVIEVVVGVFERVFRVRASEVVQGIQPTDDNPIVRMTLERREGRKE
ncbi:unnamed protein product [Pylaiella littoralis]